MTRDVILMPSAEFSRDENYLYLTKRSPQGAERWFECFERAIDQVAADADRFGRANEADRLGDHLRQVTFGIRRTRPTHRMIFTITSDKVFVVALLRHSQQDWQG